MEHAVALFVLFCGIAGVLVCLCGLFIAKDKIMARFLSVYSVAFCLIVYVGVAMLGAIS